MMKVVAVMLLCAACGDDVELTRLDADAGDVAVDADLGCCALLPDEGAFRACLPPLPPNTCGVVACPTDSGFVKFNVCGPVTPPQDAARALRPLVLALHGLYGTGTAVTNSYHLDALDDVVVLAPTATGQMWNSGASSCCAGGGGGSVDDLVDLVTDRLAMGDVDPERVYVWGASNGGAMAWRLACERPDLFGVAVTQAGIANSPGDTPCAPGRRSILVVHGTADAMIAYDPPTSTINGMPEPYPPVSGSGGSLDQARELAGCSGSLDVVGLVPITNNANKDILRWSGGCTNGYAEHWRFNNGGHSPPFDITWAPALLAWSEAHRASL